MMLALMQDNQGNYVSDRMDQLYRLGDYSGLPAWDTTLSIEEKKVKYYVCKKAVSGSVTLSAEASTACTQRISEAEGGN